MQSYQGPPPTCLLVRTHNPTPAQVERIGEWFRLLQGSGFELFVSVDVTAPAGLAAVSALCTRIPAARIHTYTEVEMITQYFNSMQYFVDPVHFPGGAGAKRVHAERRAQGYSLAWGLHVEPICLWAHMMGFRFSHVWVCEDDIGFSGDLPSFLRAYEHDPADLLTNTAAPSSAFKAPQVKCGVVVRPGSGWFWHDTCSPAYARQVPSFARYKTSEHINRFSNRLIRELDRLSRVEGVSAWSEQFVISIALQRERGFHVSLFRPEHIGSPYQWNGRVSAREWIRICREDRAAWQQGAAHAGFAQTVAHSMQSHQLEPAPGYMLPALSYGMPLLLPTGMPAPLPSAPPPVQAKRRRIDFSWPSPFQEQRHGFEGRIYHALKF
mmetsp:Transcript_11/g.34  ORF Transcript_11/g.34 Transcript_11/m.34 type:complete len:381 (-) Transcript_11:209-1351(-)